MDDTVHDDLKHGEAKQQFGTGAQRDTQGGKVRYSLVPPGPQKRVATIYTKGGVHYGDHNWTMGIPFSRYLESHDRHIEAFKCGEEDEDHLAMAVWNLYGIMHHQEAGPPGLDDLPRWGDPQWQATGLTPDQQQYPHLYPNVFEKLEETGKLEMVVARSDSNRLLITKLRNMGFKLFEDVKEDPFRDAHRAKLGINPQTQLPEPIQESVPEGYREEIFAAGPVLIHEDIDIVAGDFPMRLFIKPMEENS